MYRKYWIYIDNCADYHMDPRDRLDRDKYDFFGMVCQLCFILVLARNSSKLRILD